MSKHTPGPWIVYDDSNDGKTNRIEIAALGKTVARIYYSVPEEDLPNAQLIAAAPDLLEVLKELLDHVEWRRVCDQEKAGPKDVTHRAHAAIAKAEGVKA